ncbi:hypothetical protein HQ325_02585 [Rhodococcus sp. BP-349]|nr:MULTISPECIES: hypothetical protein [unclassified Rhodococcus (in: high G+C Gram-positive bacteria)]MBY6691950.1 hypothetical protein [Rhodococcus sp. BP-331]MBY6537550.1 hypothetical protein [Rhodococcus sp. BP-363]MBY6541887.1 hypothetical protein [Rhodococcus sp. BP-369]MBY6575409.1 hypothetical protein [Rhodococcus sp. BP-364]MBY6584710.1 hypothetical protein [Rhodococcus sp. BP-358]
MISAPVRTLLSLDREIRRAATGSGARIAIVITAIASLGAMYAITLSAQPSARATLAALCAVVVVVLTVVAPLLTGVGDRGLVPAHVRHLPVRADDLRRALALIGVRSGGALFLIGGLALTPLALPGASPVARAVAAVVALLTVGVALGLSRVAILRLDAASRTPRGRILSTIGGTVVAAAAYAAFLLLGNVSTAIAGNGIIRTAVRVLPTGWAAVSSEAVDDGRWWLPVLVVLALVGLGVLVVRWWTSAVSDALDSTPPRVRTDSPRRASAFRARGPLVTAISAEARLLILDPRRVGLLTMPGVFLLVGVVLMATSTDIYGLQYGAPIVILLTSSMFANSYGLDGAAAWRATSVPGVARRVIDARLVIAAVVAVAFGAVGTVLGRLVGDPSPRTLPVAAAVVVAASLATAAAGAVQSAASPYVVAGQTGASALNSRGSMTGRAIGWTLGVMAVGALLCVPGVLVALALPGIFVWLGPIVALLLGGCIVAVARRRAEALVADRGPEIFATVSA